MGSLGWAPIPHDWCPYRKRSDRRRERPHEDTGRRSHRQEIGLGDPPAHSEIPNAQPPGLGASVFLLLKPLLWNFVMVALRSKYNNRPEEATSGRCQDPVRTFRSSPLPTGTLQ